MESHYAWIKMAHVVGVILFVGNMIVTALWKSMADRTREPRVVAFGQRLVALTDYTFTAPGAALVLVTGLLMAFSFEGTLWHEKWLPLGVALFGASGLIWVSTLLPIQLRQSRLAEGFAGGGPIPAEYRRLGRRWMIWGALATALPLVNIYLMVLRPT